MLQDVSDIVNEVEISSEELHEASEDAIPEDDSIPAKTGVAHQESQCNLTMSLNVFQNWRIALFSDQPTVIQFYTGFSSFAHFNFFFDCLGPAVNELNYQSKILSPENELFCAW